MELEQLKVAVVHDFLYCYGGAERVLEQILRVIPHADLFSLFDFLPKNARSFIQDRPAQTSFLQKLPFAKTKHRLFLPVMPMAIERLDVSDYDLVISSSYLVAKGVRTHDKQLHICYCHTPARFAWGDPQPYLELLGLDKSIFTPVIRCILNRIRKWDMKSADNVDVYITNSQFVAERVKEVYQRESTVIYPPVDVERFTLCEQKDDFYLTVSRQVIQKRIDLIVKAFVRMPDKKLVVIGQGPELKRMQALAQGHENISILGYQPFEVVRTKMQQARAFVFASEEDFGIVPAEAQACGTPVIAYGKGGATESVAEGETGIFFNEQTTESVIEAVNTFERSMERWNPKDIRASVDRFAVDRFRDEFLQFVQDQWSQFQANTESANAA